jgi:hypothetical protein
MENRNAPLKAWLFTAAASLGYMGCVWFFFRVGDSRLPGAPLVGVMSASYLLFAPFATGAVVNWSKPKAERGRLMNLLVAPALHSLLALLIAFVIRIEGIICLIMAIPIFVFLSWMGAVFYHLLSKRMEMPGENRAMVALLLLPICAAPIESRFHPGVRASTTLSQIEIEAPSATVWRNIIRVPRIAKSEIPLSLSMVMGFPDPVEATLSHEGMGGVRRASFQGNVLFTETIDAWDEGRMLSFSIVPNTADIPPTTMDEHMIVGGRYFNVLRGTYAIEDLEGGRCLLKLSSDHVATTDINLYADLWGRLLMGDIQDRILKVIKVRCERGFMPPAGV